MSAPTALVAEDEDVLREELCAHLVAQWPALRIVAQADNGVDALEYAERLRPDVLFLDIQMPGITGLEVARRIGPGRHVVFITAYDSHAVAAFERGAVDYLLKPYAPARLAESLRRVRERMEQSPPALDSVLREIAAALQPRQHLRWINASIGQEVKIITVDEVCYFQADSKYTLVISAAGEALVRRALKDLASQLDPSQFWQVHRSTIVNVSAIAGVSRDLRGHIRLKLKTRPETLAVSEAHEHLFRSM
jgi:DNA-binding LytR/AlgR family response regulator